ncbi:hypothetical protein [Paenibacillus sp. yr247]|uniref:glycoside hydrolase family 78 protein n=1 Tax=Paenibacillus sp. yr247 TaxID=1761880 RepID=UPI001C31648D|nr:hypothetical protein [Paenibacillus sp. yr247]
MPTLPGCSSTDFPELQTLSLGGIRDSDKPFKTDTAVGVPDSAVTGVVATSAQVNDSFGSPIGGPNGYSGYPRSATITVVGVDPNANSAGQYRVTFQQKFLDVSDKESEQDLAAPAPPNGAKVITYYEAFTVDLQGSTYEYDGNVTVEYAPPPNGANLSSVAITAPSCVEVNKSESFSFSFANTGGTDVTVPFQAKVVIDGSTYQTYDYTGLPSGQSKTETFTKNFGGTSSYNVGVIVDTVAGETNTGDNSKSVTVAPQISCAAAPTPEVITGDFTLDKTTMSYGQSNSATPVGVSVTGNNGGTVCAISQFGFIFEQNGITRDYVGVKSSPTAQGFSGPPYPGGMGQGFVNVTMKLVTTCGTTKVFNTKSFEITIDPNNNAPFGSPGWFANHNTNNYPTIDEIVVGNYVDLGVIQDKTRTPNEPYDPEGNGFFPTWDFAGSSDPWIQNLGDAKNGYGFYEHDERFSNIKADVLGFHTVRMKLTDTKGAESGWRSATINVVKPNPIAACDAPTQMKSNRPLAANAINADKSRSPLGLAIDHSKDEWTNKQPTYQNSTGSDITVTVTLNKVYDSAGLASENISSCNIIVHPDLPPIAKINAPTLGNRGDSYDILNQSYSPDGDTLVQTIWYVRYDANNDGVFDDVTEPYSVVTGTLSKYDFKPTKVGKYKFKLRAIEDYGAWAEAESGILDVINQAPTVSFDLAGNSPSPDPNPPTLYKASDMLNLWQLFATNSNIPLSKTSTYNWQNENEALQSGAGKGKEMQNFGANVISTPYGFGGATAYSTPLNDNGFGKNGVSVYKAMAYADPSYAQPLLIPDASGQPSGFLGGSTPIESDKTHLYFQLAAGTYDNPIGTSFYALNKSKIGRYQLELVWSTPCSGCFSSGTYTHRWLDGNPYDYILNYKNLPTSNLITTKTVPHYHNSTQDGTVQMQETIPYTSVRSVFAEKTVYMLFTKNTPTKVIYDTTGDSDRTYTNWSYNSMACSFKALDGSFIGCFDVPSTNGSSTTTLKDTITKGDHLLFLFDSDGYYSTNGYFGNSFSEVDLYGNVVNTGAITGNNPQVPVTYEAKYTQWPDSYTPISYSPKKYVNTNCWFNQTGTPYKDRDGNTYFYEEKVCQAPDGSTMRGYNEFNYRAYPELALGIYVAKYNKDYKVVWRARTGGNSLSFSAAWTFDWNENINTMIVNPLNNTIISKTLYTVGGYWGDSRTTINNTIDMTTGAVWGWGGPLVTGMGTSMHVDGAGNYAWGACAANIYNQCSDINTGGNGRILQGNVGFFSSATETVNTRAFSEYMGDGLLLSTYMWHQWSTGYNSPPYGQTVYWIDKGPIAEAPAITPRYQFGQFLSSPVISDADISFNFKTEQNKVDTEKFGFAFRAQDAMNRYALEFDGTNVFLSKYVSGVRTVLATSAYNVQDSKSYSVQIRTAGNTINVWINKVNYFADIVDNTYPVSGKFGPFADKSFVNFSAMTMKPYAETDLWDSAHAILDDKTGKAELDYSNIVFSDPENDPMADSFNWTYTHTPMFLDNGGVSPLNGKSFSSGQPVFDRVGKWDVTLKAKDDPYPTSAFKFPNMAFDAYRKNSNTFKKSIVVHRRPIAVFTAAMQPTGFVSFTTDSYDPDHYNPVSKAVDSGYESNHGIFEEKWYYIAPDGTLSQTKLDKVTDSGTYTIGLQVKDEFGAWSWPVTTTLDVGLKPNNPPKAVLTYPSGTQDSPDYLCINCNPTLAWNQTDIDPDTTFTAFEISITSYSPDGWGGYYSNESTTSKVVSTKAEAAQWFASNIWGAASIKWKVKVRVKDETLWSAWSNEGWFSSVKLPTVQLTFPNGTYDNPSPVTSLRPTITWDQKDEAAGRIAYQQVRVMAKDGTIVASADISVPFADRTKLSDSWTMNVDATRGAKLKVQVRVMNEQSAWSTWSNVGWFTTNSPPVATMTTPSGTQATPTMFTTTKPTFEWTQTDPDTGTTFSHFEIQVTSEDNATMVLDSGVLVENSTSSTGSWTATSDLPAGQKLRVRVRVFDGYVWSNYSPQTWMLIDRAPIADFDWSPKPAYEGDIVSLINKSSDPDNDVLSSLWTITNPAGAITTLTSINGTMNTLNQPGTWSVTLKVTDPYGVTASVTKSITVLALTITGAVQHTPQWENNRKAYNQLKTGTDNSPWAPSTFLAGEEFDLVGITTNTGSSSTKATSVIVTLVETGDQTSLSASDSTFTSWIGSLWKSSYDMLTAGTYHFKFVATWNNGTVKQDIQTITVDSHSIHDYWELIRSK